MTVIDWANSEPPNRYVLAYGTEHCLIEQDYDHSIYQECAYISARTLIKCKAVRKIADLKANGGICEMHSRFRDAIRERYLFEERRLLHDSGTGKPKYSPFVCHDKMICDEYPWLMPSHRWESPLTRPVYDEAPDDDPVAPLRNAGVFTEKDVLKMRKALCEKKIEYLKLRGEMLVERARRKASELFSNTGKMITLGEPAAAVAAACASLDDYGYLTKRINSSQKYKSGEWARSEPPLCSFGKTTNSGLENDDNSVVSSIMGSILECVINETTKFESYERLQKDKESCAPIEKSEEVKSCTFWKVPLSDYCIRHQMLDERQCLFVPCSKCHNMCADVLTPPLCPKHLKADFEAKRHPEKQPSAPTASTAFGVRPTSPSSKLKAVNDPTKPLFGLPTSNVAASSTGSSLADKRVPTKRFSVDAPREDVELPRKRSKIEVPVQNVGQVHSQTESSAVTEAIQRSEMHRRETEHSTCARIRPFQRSNFPPKISTQRRFLNVGRPPNSVRRLPVAAESTSLLDKKPARFLHANRLAAGSESVAPSHFSGSPKMRRPHPVQRVFSKDATSSHSYQPSSSSNKPLVSSPVLIPLVDESGNELVEDRRTPPPEGEADSTNSGEAQAPSTSQARSFAYHRKNPYVSMHRPSFGSYHQETSSVHSTLPPPPDPPILPPPTLPHGGTRPGSIASAAGTTVDRDIAESGHLGTRGIVNYGRDARPETPIFDVDDRILLPPPPAPNLCARAPTILRRSDASQHSVRLIPLNPQPSPTLTTSPVRIPTVPIPRPPPASRPLPPHRLLNPPRAVPPHRLIKSLPLPVVPSPRAPKPSNMESVNKPEGTQSSSSEDQPTTSADDQNGRVSVSQGEAVPEETSQAKTTQENANQEKNTQEITDQERLNQERILVDKATELSAANLDPLSILAAVSEAARDAEVNSAQQSHSSSSTAGTNTGEDDEDFEEEL